MGCCWPPRNRNWYAFTLGGESWTSATAESMPSCYAVVEFCVFMYGAACPRAQRGGLPNLVWPVAGAAGCQQGLLNWWLLRCARAASSRRSSTRDNHGKRPMIRPAEPTIINEHPDRNPGISHADISTTTVRGFDIGTLGIVVSAFIWRTSRIDAKPFRLSRNGGQKCPKNHISSLPPARRKTKSVNAPAALSGTGAIRAAKTSGFGELHALSHQRDVSSRRPTCRL